MLKAIRRSGAGYVLPAAAVVAVVMLYPLLYTLIMGFFNNTLFMEVRFFADFPNIRSCFRTRCF